MGIDGQQPATLNTQPATLYDLSGHRITGTPSKGLYIKDGKKIYVK